MRNFVFTLLGILTLPIQAAGFVHYIVVYAFKAGRESAEQFIWRNK